MQRYPFQPVLIIDNEIDVLSSYETTLCLSEIRNLVLCSNPFEVMNLLAGAEYSAMILDLNMPYLSGLELLEKIHEHHPEIPIIVVTASNQVEAAVECMKLGAFDYMVKPIEACRLITVLKNALELFESRGENHALGKMMLGREFEKTKAFSEIVTVSSSMKVIFGYINAIAASTKPVLITGESGVGKELIARAIHNASNRQGKFVAVNVAGLDNVAFSDTLFGHRRGAYTGADIERHGLIEGAADGTLFLDEIGSLDNNAQIKLLRLLQENEYYQLGSDICKTARTTIIAATNENLYARMKENLFRKDLFYRLLTHHIEVPPLRTRKEDLTVLVDHFVTQASISLDKKKPEIPTGLLNLLGKYDFPGNIRELESLMFDSVGRCQSLQLDISLFEHYFAKQGGVFTDGFAADTCNQYHIPYFGKFPKLREVQDFLIEDAIKKAGGSQYGAAELLGVAQSTLWRKVKKKTN